MTRACPFRAREAPRSRRGTKAERHETYQQNSEFHDCLQSSRTRVCTCRRRRRGRSCALTAEIPSRGVPRSANVAEVGRRRQDSPRPPLTSSWRSADAQIRRGARCLCRLVVFSDLYPTEGLLALSEADSSWCDRRSRLGKSRAGARRFLGGGARPGRRLFLCAAD